MVWGNCDLNTGRQFPETGKATTAKDVASKPPIQADGGRNCPCPNHNSVAYSL